MKGHSVAAADVARVFLFGGLDEERLVRIAAATSRHELRAGGALFHRGQTVSHCYYVEQGQIQLSRSSAAGEETTLALFGPGRTFAEALVFLPPAMGYPVDARALERTVVLAFATAPLRAMLVESTDTCMRIMTSMCHRLHELVHQIDALTLHDGTYRLVSYLLRELPESTGAVTELRLPVAKNVIASHLSLQPETLSRILGNLRRAGLIDTDGPQITLTDIGGLRRLLEP